MSTAVLNYGANARKDELLEKIGGKKVLHDAVDRFYGRLLQDPELGRFFTGSNLLLLKWHQFNFMSIAFSSVPEDLDLQQLILEKHKRLFENIGLNEKHFDIMIKHLRETFEELNIEKDLINHATSVLAPLRVVFKNGAEEAKARRGSSEALRRLQIAAALAIVGVCALRYVHRR
jgi:hemoglobin